MTRLAGRFLFWCEMSEYRNRIVERKRMRVGDLQPNRYNPKSHPLVQEERLKAVLARFGVVTELVAYYSERNDGALSLFDGHERQHIDPDQEWDIAITDLTDEEVDELVLYFDPLAALARQEADKTAALMAGLQVQEAALREHLEEQAAGLGFVFGGNGEEPPEDVGPQVDRAAELQEIWGTQLGQIWELGEHRLAVGDCTDRGVVEAVMGGKQAQLAWIDPPYGVNYEGGAKQRNPIENDDSIDVASAGLKMVHNILQSGGVIYCASPPKRLFEFWQVFLLAGFHYSMLLIWVKNNFAGGWGDYRGIYEAILYGWKSGGTHKWYGGRDKSTVLHYDKPIISVEHPTMKPTPLVSECVENSSKGDDIVVDFFLGSGTTMIAAEKLGRRCFGIEIDPGYCAVAIQRWHGMTGLEPQLVT
jgi:DNA modification methylase